MPQPRLLILGTRGIPAAHGGFETFAERLALFLVERGWEVAVYCQRDVARIGERFTTDRWKGVERIHVEVSAPGPGATLEFDWHCVRDAARRSGVCLVLGYNGAIFLPYLRLAGRRIITNMDGIEWRRPKWSAPVKAWFWINEWVAAWSSNRLVADHPRIADHLATRRPRGATVMIPYGGDPVGQPSAAPVAALGLEPSRYLVSIARIEPDNNTGLLIESFSRQRRGIRLVVLGELFDKSSYHRAIRALASDEVLFPGGIYDRSTVQALRHHARGYVHGHMVGGTNPSLVESLWAGNAVIAHDNAYNRWTAGDAALYFDDLDSCEALIERVATDDALVMRCKAAALTRAKEQFEWNTIFSAYEHEILALGGRLQPVLDPAPHQGMSLPVSLAE